MDQQIGSRRGNRNNGQAKYQQEGKSENPHENNVQSKPGLENKHGSKKSCNYQPFTITYEL